MRRTIFFVSDGTGIAAETLGHTLSTRFEGVDARRVTRPFVAGADKAQSVGPSIASRVLQGTGLERRRY